MVKHSLWAIASCLFAGFSSLQANAQVAVPTTADSQTIVAPAPTAQIPPVTATIVANRDAGTPRSDYQVGILIRHQPGWHTYWRNPGESGYPISIEWNLPKNWKATPVGWPLPTRIESGGITSFTYSGAVLLPFKLEIPWGTPYGTRGTIVAKVKWLACNKICVPGGATLRYTLPIQVRSEPTAEAELFTYAKQHMPEVVESPGITATLEGKRIRIDMPTLAGKSLDFIPLERSTIDYKGGSRLQKTNKTTSLFVTAHPDLIKAPSDLKGIVVVDGGPDKGGWAIETRLALHVEDLPVAEQRSTAPSKPVITKRAVKKTSTLSFKSAVFFAFIGGLILNLMPCVFPILSFKILHLIDNSRRRGPLMLHGLTFLLGVLLSMLILAALLIVARSFGGAIGWGFQLQSSWVIATLVLLFCAISMNLSGLYEFTASSHLTDSRAARALPKTGPWGSFFMGVLAVVVATPCTAPFMGAALGYAVTQPYDEACVVFIALGFGMALPWFLLTVFPFWAKWLPKPGRWMETVRHIMAIPMFLATIWLVWVLSNQVSAGGVIVMVIAVAACSIFLWCVGREQYGRGESRLLKWVSGAFIVVIMGLMVLGHFDENKVQENRDGWQPWTQNAVDSAIAMQNPVIVDFTATWCVTCQYNKVMALRTKASEKLMSSLGYRRFVADWTTQNADITNTLSAFGRTGVPLYLIYNTQGEVSVLPELLTESALHEALKKNAR